VDLLHFIIPFFGFIFKYLLFLEKNIQDILLHYSITNSILTLIQPSFMCFIGIGRNKYLTLEDHVLNLILSDFIWSNIYQYQSNIKLFQISNSFIRYLILSFVRSLVLCLPPFFIWIYSPFLSVLQSYYLNLLDLAIIAKF